MQFLINYKNYIKHIAIGLTIVLLCCGCGQDGSGGNMAQTHRVGSAVKQDLLEKKKNQGQNEDLVPGPLTDAAFADGSLDTMTAISGLFIVEKINQDDNSISLYNVNGNRRVTYKYNMTTRFLDKYGNYSGLANFPSGTMVSVRNTSETDLYLKEMQISATVWRQSDVNSFSIDSARNVFNIGGINYRILDTTLIYSDGNPALLGDITEDDILTVIGYDKDILTVNITTGHGYLSLLNTGVFENTPIKIGTKFMTDVKAGEIIEVPEGTYDVTVASQGWGGTGSVTIKRGEITEFDLETIKGSGPSYCSLTVSVGVSEAVVYVDGTEIPADTPTDVKYGTHVLRITAPGYDLWQRYLVVNSSSANIAVDLSSNMQANNSNNNISRDEDVLSERNQEAITTDNQALIDALADSVMENITGRDNGVNADVNRLNQMADTISQLF